MQTYRFQDKLKLTFSVSREVSIRISNNSPSSSRSLFTIRVKDLLCYKIKESGEFEFRLIENKKFSDGSS